MFNLTNAEQRQVNEFHGFCQRLYEWSREKANVSDVCKVDGNLVRFYFRRAGHNPEKGETPHSEFEKWAKGMLEPMGLEVVSGFLDIYFEIVKKKIVEEDLPVRAELAKKKRMKELRFLLYPVFIERARENPYYRDFELFIQEERCEWCDSKFIDDDAYCSECLKYKPKN